MKYTAAVITVSDKGSQGLRQDTSGPTVRAMLEEAGFAVTHTAILPDEMERISAELRDCADRRGIDLIVTTGGTGLSPRDVTPEATRAVLEREIPAHAGQALAAMGHEVEVLNSNLSMGRGQIIWRTENGLLVGGTEPRCDGMAAAW